MNSPITLILLAIIAAVALETVIYWHVQTKGTWKDWPAGRSLMYLLVIIATGFGYGVLNRFLGEYPARTAVSFILYAAFVGALIVIRGTIRAEMRKGRREKLKTKLPTNTEPVEIIVATTNKESDNV